jgi:hypothetical protein
MLISKITISVSLEIVIRLFLLKKTGVFLWIIFEMKIHLYHGIFRINLIYFIFITDIV